ncbi:MAG: competence type IV pilus minor pilin ComGG [Bacillus sp. (in: firmicutes)]
MLRNEKGYITLPALILLSLLLSISLASSAAFVSEKQFSRQVESKLIVDHLIFLAYCDLREMLTPEIVTSGMLTYEKGVVTYQIMDITDETMKVTLNASNEINGKSEVMFIYNYTLKEVIRWIEVI